MLQLYKLAENCLYSMEVEQKLDTTFHAYQLHDKNQLRIQHDHATKSIAETRFPESPELVNPRDLPKRSIQTRDGRVALLHAIAHIEFYAIHLAWDIIYRFGGMPDPFYIDWLNVAYEEATHFSMVRKRLGELDSDYGMLPAHRGLWEVAEDTDHDVLARLALVPRYMEARGLDVTPKMIEKLEQAKDQESAEILKIILRDEIRHVEVGSRWFCTVCKQRNLDSETTYFDLLERFLRGKIRGPFNHDLRTEAGFSASEIHRLEALGR